MELISPYIQDVYKKVRPGFQKAFGQPTIKAHLEKVWVNLGIFLQQRGVTPELLATHGLNYFIKPNLEDVFNAFSYFDPQNIVIIILGQDPYPIEGMAHGLCFSSKIDGVPQSLVHVYSALIRSNLIEKEPTTANLESWAKQGILLLNRYLTRSVDFSVSGNDVVLHKRKAQEADMHPFWADFTSSVVSYLIGPHLLKGLNHENHVLALMLWGGPAKAAVSEDKIATIKATLGNSKSPFSDDMLSQHRKLLVYDRPHPSPMADNQLPPERKFCNCDHFTKVNEELAKMGFPTIDWNPHATIKNSRLSQFFYKRHLNEPIDSIALFEMKLAYPDGTKEANNVKLLEYINKKKELTRTETPASTPAPTLIPKLKHPGWLMVCTDGGCENNHIKNDKFRQAKFGVYVMKDLAGVPNILKTRSMSGDLPRYTLELDGTSLTLTETTTAVNITNNRAELLAAINALVMFIQHPEAIPAILISDSEYVIHFINERYWAKRMQYSTKWDQHVDANNDLAKILGMLLFLLARKYDPTLKYAEIQKSWHTVIQPAGRNWFEKRGGMDLNWRGLTCLYQRAHQTTPTDSPCTVDNTVELETGTVILTKEQINLSKHHGNSIADSITAGKWDLEKTE